MKLLGGAPEVTEPSHRLGVTQLSQLHLAVILDRDQSLRNYVLIRLPSRATLTPMSRGQHVSSGPRIRRDLRPGDLGAIVAQHGLLYARKHGLDASFEAHVCHAVAHAASRGWPSAREGAWIVEDDDTFAGSLALTDEGDGIGALRWFLLDEAFRGHGLGRRLVRGLVREAKGFGYDMVRLETFSDLRAAAFLYRREGFKLTSAESGSRWGRRDLTYQRYELRLSPAGDKADEMPVTEAASNTAG